MLGDGRANLLGEIEYNGCLYDIQLKGSGRTPFSRGGDGLAAIGPMMREYVISEYLHSVNIPTSRTLFVFDTNEKVYRETVLNGAVLTRIAKSHLRVGTFQYAKAYTSLKDLRLLTDYAIERHYKELIGDDKKYFKFFIELTKRQASLIAKWMSIGFIHGVMNTDNMTISGESIDFGPCAFLEEFDKDTVFSSIDRMGRYSYKNQGIIGAWNLARFSESIYDLIIEEGYTKEDIEKVLTDYLELFQKNLNNEYRKKLGLIGEEYINEDLDIVSTLLNILEKNKLDYTNSFRDLTYKVLGLDIKIEDDSIVNLNDKEYKDWEQMWLKRLNLVDVEKSGLIMKNSNPVVIPRNLVLDKALKKANDKDYGDIFEVIDILKEPFNYDRKIPVLFTKKMSEGEKAIFRTYCGT